MGCQSCQHAVLSQWGHAQGRLPLCRPHWAPWALLALQHPTSLVYTQQGHRCGGAQACPALSPWGVGPWGGLGRSWDLRQCQPPAPPRARRGGPGMVGDWPRRALRPDGCAGAWGGMEGGAALELGGWPAAHGHPPGPYAPLLVDCCECPEELAMGRTWGHLAPPSHTGAAYPLVPVPLLPGATVPGSGARDAGPTSVPCTPGRRGARVAQPHPNKKNPVPQEEITE